MSTDSVPCDDCGAPVAVHTRRHYRPLCAACLQFRFSDLVASGYASIATELQTYAEDGADAHNGPIARAEVRFESDRGIRVVLGSADGEPDVYIERFPDGWRIFLHPHANDLIGVVAIDDDGSFRVLPESSTDREICL